MPELYQNMCNAYKVRDIKHRAQQHSSEQYQHNLKPAPKAVDLKNCYAREEQMPLEGRSDV